jgi:hypothetical protein
MGDPVGETGQNTIRSDSLAIQTDRLGRRATGRKQTTHGSAKEMEKILYAERRAEPFSRESLKRSIANHQEKQ